MPLELLNEFAPYVTILVTAIGAFVAAVGGLVSLTNWCKSYLLGGINDKVNDTIRETKKIVEDIKERQSAVDNNLHRIENYLDYVRDDLRDVSKKVTDHIHEPHGGFLK